MPIDINQYRRYINRSKPLMGMPLYYVVADDIRAEDAVATICQRYGPKAEIKILKYNGTTYIGVIERSD